MATQPPKRSEHDTNTGVVVNHEEQVVVNHEEQAGFKGTDEELQAFTDGAGGDSGRVVDNDVTEHGLLSDDGTLLRESQGYIIDNKVGGIVDGDTNGLLEEEGIFRTENAVADAGFGKGARPDVGPDAEADQVVIGNDFEEVRGNEPDAAIRHAKDLEMDAAGEVDQVVIGNNFEEVTAVDNDAVADSSSIERPLFEDKLEEVEESDSLDHFEIQD